MAKVRIHEIAKELGSSSKKILEKAKELGFAVTTVSSAVSQEDAEKLYIYARSGIIPDNAPVKKSTPKKDPKSEIEAKKNIKEESKSSIADTKKIKYEPKESPKDEPKEQTLGNSSLNKRRGLVIVKKKKDEQPKEQKPSQSIINNQALESMFGSSDESLKKKKKDKKQFHATKKESSSKLDLMGLSEFGDDIVIDDENVVILPDLTLKPIEVERQQTIKKPLNVYKQSQNSGFNLDGGIQRSSRKKHKK